MPIDDVDLRGSEIDGSRSEEYCMFCYEHGHYINPGMRLDEMKSLVKQIMQKKNLSPFIVEQAVAALPGLKRWRAELNSVIL